MVCPQFGCFINNQTDDQLVALCNSGSGSEAKSAFNTLYQRHKPYVLKVASRFGADNDLALDVLQETFSYLLRKFPPPGEGLQLTAKFTTFLYPVIKHTTLDLKRKRERYVTDEALPEAIDESSTLESSIHGLLKDLSPEHREVILLRFVDGFTMEEIAQSLEVPLGTVKSRTHNAIAKLRNDPETKKFFFP